MLLLTVALATARFMVGGCELKPGVPSPYKPVCTACATEATCAVLNATCVWVTPPVGATCEKSEVVEGFDTGGTVVMQPSPEGGGMFVDSLPVPDGQAGLDQCRESCCCNQKCQAWTVAGAGAPASAAPPPCTPGKPCCWHKDGAVDRTTKCPYCKSSSFAAPAGPAPAKGYWCNAGYQMCEQCRYKCGGCTAAELNTTNLDCENACDPQCHHPGCPYGYLCRWDGHHMACQGPTYDARAQNLTTCQKTCGGP